MQTCISARNYGDPSVVGESTWVPKAVLFAYRFVACLATIIIFSYYAAAGLLRLQYLTVWVLYLSGVSYGIASITCVVSRRWLAQLSTILYHVFFTFSLLVTPIYWVLEFPNATAMNGQVTLARLYPHGGTAIVFIADLILSGQLEFRFFDLIWMVCFGVIYLVFIFIRFGITRDIPYDFLDFRKVSAGRSVLVYFMIIIIGVILGAIVVLLSRCTRLYQKKLKKTVFASTETT